VLPWTGIMALGYGLGPVFLEPASARAQQFTLLGSRRSRFSCCCAEPIFMAIHTRGASSATA